MSALDWLFQQFPSYQVLGSKAFKPTLDNTKKILEFLNSPEKDLKFIHVAGSNGKGSVSSLIASILTESGLKPGLFTSPHIVDFTERIRINGEPIQMDNVESFVERVRSTEFDFSPSFFEITFGMALDHFRNEQCDICVIETGLGGRLDATNVIRPELSVITTISLEHTAMLGDTLEEIATEKAGIIKSSGDVVLGNIVPKLLPILESKARDAKVSILLSSNTNIDAYKHYFIADYQLENCKTAITAIREFLPEIDKEAIHAGIKNLHQNTGLFGRLQVMNENPLILFDVSHNADGIKATLDTVKSISRGNLYIVYGTSSDKDLEQIKLELPKDACYYFTAFSNPRSASLTQLKSTFDGINLKSTHYYEDAKKALAQAKSDCHENDTILVIGSFFLLSDFF